MVRERWSRLRVKLTDGLKREVEAALEKADGNEAKLLQSALEHGDMTVEELKAFSKSRKDGKPLRDLLQGVEFPKEPEKPEDPALVERREWLLARQAARDYQAKVSNLSTGYQSRHSVQNSVKELRKTMREISVGFSMILLCVSVFFAVKMFTESAGYTSSTGIVMGLLGGSAMLIIEMTLFVIRSTREEKLERTYKSHMENQRLHNLSPFPVSVSQLSTMKTTTQATTS